MPATMPVPDSSLQFTMNNPAGITRLTIVVVVSLQASSAATVVVAPPVVDTVRLYDVSKLAPDVRASDGCALAVVDENVQTVLELDGAQFGATPAFFSIQLSNATTSAFCSPCYLQHTKARCITSTRRSFPFNLTVTVSGQVSNVLPYSYDDVFAKTPPQVASVGVAPAGGVAQLSTVGGDLVSIQGLKQGRTASKPQRCWAPCPWPSCPATPHRWWRGHPRGQASRGC